MTEHLTTPVLIVGGGPVGLTLAVDLGQRGISCVLIERKEKLQFLPKMERCNARTMEIFRRLGLADEIRAASFPADARMDVSVVTHLADEPVVRLVYPTVREAKAASRQTFDGTLPLEPYQVVSQYTLEPLLKSHAEALDSVTLRFGCELQSFEQDDEGVTASLHGLDGEQLTIRADYVVACDGGRSTVRKQLGIALEGEGRIATRNQVFFKSDNLFDVYPFDPSRMYFFANEDQSIITVQDDLKHFSFHTNCFGSEDEIRRVMEEALGLACDFEIITAVEWTLHLMVAERLTEGRVFIAGDAGRLIIPSGGLGLNTGIGEAADLAWKLGATVEGWGGRHLLASYEAERLPVSRRNRDSSRYANAGQRIWRELVRPEINDDTPEGRGIRRAVAYSANAHQRRTHEMVGTELGYRYEESPIISHETGPWPPDTPETYIPTSRPGARLPHFWLSDGTALHDQINRCFTLVRLDPTAPGLDELQEAFRVLGTPIETLELNEPDIRTLCGASLILVRPDLHVAWRGDDVPADVKGLASLVTGH